MNAWGAKLLLVLFAATTAGQPPTAQVTEPKPNLEVTGRVVNGRTGQPLPGVHLALRGDSQKNKTLTGYDGTFSIHAPEVRRYFLGAARSGFWFRMIEVNLTALAAGKDIVLKMWRHPVITGIVTDPSGEPIEGATVSAYRKHFGNNGVSFAERNNRATTDDRGIYRIIDLKPRNYVVLALPAPEPSLPGELHYAFAPVFHPNGDSLSGAGEQRLTWGTQLSGIDFQFRRAGETAVAGNLVLGSGNRRVPGQQVTLVKTDGPFVQEFGRVTTTSNGVFVFDGLSPGEHLAVTEFRHPESRAMVYGQQAVRLLDSMTVSCVIQVETGHNISEKVVFEADFEETPTRRKGAFGLQISIDPVGPRIHRFYGEHNPKSAAWDTGELLALAMPPSVYRLCLTARGLSEANLRVRQTIE